jgi:F-type H+-transporting ATPase subunit gamma
MEEQERALERLENIRSVKPILGGLRTISLGSWQAALKRRSGVRDYAQRLRAMLPGLVSQLQARKDITAGRRWHSWPSKHLSPTRTALAERRSASTRVEALVIGSERGLCGRFNATIADEAERYLRSQSSQGIEARLKTLGSRAQRVLQRRGYQTDQASALSTAALPSFALAFGLAQGWLAAYERQELDAVDLIYNAYRGTGAYKPTVVRLIPPRISAGVALSSYDDGSNRSLGGDGPSRSPFLYSNDFSDSPSEEGAQHPGTQEVRQRATQKQRGRPWPPPIVETDPLSLYATVVEQWAAVQLYEVLLDAAAAEHSTRFQLMESATQNADRLIDELTLTIQTARRHEITQEMAELAAGAGLIGRQ